MESRNNSAGRQKKIIDNIKKKIGWQWFHVPENQKDSELKKILSNYGFQFSETEIKEVVRRKYVKRKPGTRPEKISVSSYVLNNFREEEVPLLKKIILKSCEGINLLIANEDEECRRLFSKTMV